MHFESEHTPNSAHRPAVDRRSLDARGERALDAFLAIGGHESDWAAVAQPWWYAVEWFENRPSSGASAGEQLCWALGRFDRSAPAWTELDELERGRWGAAAAKLRKYRWNA